MKLNQFGDEIFQCVLCNQEFELEHDKPYLLKGSLSRDSHNQEIEIHICEYCACKLGQWDEV